MSIVDLFSACAVDTVYGIKQIRRVVDLDVLLDSLLVSHSGRHPEVEPEVAILLISLEIKPWNWDSVSGADQFSALRLTLEGSC